MFHHQVVHYIATQQLFMNLILIKTQTIQVTFQMSPHIFRFLKYLLFYSSCFIVRNFKLIMQFSFFLYTGNNIDKVILNKSCNHWCTKFSIKLVMVFFIYVLIHVCLPFNFVILKKYDLLWYPLRKYHWQLGEWTHCSWTHVW
jgi:hypothetical protein